MATDSEKKRINTAFDFDAAWERAFCSDDPAASESDDGGVTPKLIDLRGADFRFKTAPCVRRALHEFAEDGSFPYINSDSAPYRASVKHWMKLARDWDIDTDWIVPTMGTLSGICVALRAFTKEGDGVLMLKPYYGLYKRVLERADRKQIDVELINDGGEYSIDYGALEENMKHASAMILCDPHNPIMKIWPREDLRRISELAVKYNVLVLVDEIFAEHAYNGLRTIPFTEAAVDGCRAIVCTSLGKCFNLIGCNEANLIIPDGELRTRFIKQRNHDHFGSLDPMVYAMLRAAYTEEGLAWVRASIAHVEENIRIFREAMRPFPAVFSPHDATSLIWVDWSGLGMTADELEEFFRKEARVEFDGGSFYGEERAFTRCQMGAPRAVIEEVSNRISEALKLKGFMK